MSLFYREVFPEEFLIICHLDHQGDIKDILEIPIYHGGLGDSFRLVLHERQFHKVYTCTKTNYYQGRIKRRGHATVHEQKLYGLRNDTKYSYINKKEKGTGLNVRLVHGVLI